jgi:integrase
MTAPAQDAVLRIGEVIGVEGRRISVLVDKAKNLSHMFLGGEIITNIAVNSYLEIRKGFLCIIGRVEGERIEDEFRTDSHGERQPTNRSKRILTVGLAGYIDERGRFNGGTRELPLVGNEAFLLSRDQLRRVHDLVRDPKRPLTTFSNAEVRLLLAYRPKGTYHTRTWTLILCLMDTGIRIDEALGLERSKVNLDALNITVLGKGNKERIVPISLEFRKHLFRWLQKTEGRYVFGARTGTRLTYRNSYRDIKNLCKRIGIEGEHVHPHSCRHFFAVSYIRNGGDIYRLSRILGHTSISTTQLYLRSMGVEHLLEGHSQFSPLAKLA